MVASSFPLIYLTISFVFKDSYTLLLDEYCWKMTLLYHMPNIENKGYQYSQHRDKLEKLIKYDYSHRCLFGFSDEFLCNISSRVNFDYWLYVNILKI